jgi:hypothetical protein
MHKNLQPKINFFSGNWVFGIFQDKLYISENLRLSCSTENHLAFWTGYISVRTTLRTSGYHVPLKNILHSGQVIYLWEPHWEPPVIMFHWKPSCILDRWYIYIHENHLENLRLSCSTGNHLAFQTQQEYRVEWVKSKASLIGQNGVRKHFYVLDCSALHHDGVVCELSHQQQR